MSNSRTEAIDRIGELLIIGFDGKTLSDDTSAFISQARIGGVIYFTHNYETPEQIATLSNELQEARGTNHPLWISVDQEGGRVQRFREHFTILPPAEALAIKDSPKLAYDLSQMIANELRAVGVNLNYTPVADIMTNPKNPVIGDRAYGTEDQKVTKLVTAMVRGHVTNGVQPCVKHFPGHGDTDVDSHDDLPRVNKTLDELKFLELRPFVKVFKSRCNMVMTAHILNPNIDPDYPATLSKKTLQGVLRDDIRYTKLIISDDLEMGALIKHYDPVDIPVLALNAGCDQLIYRSEDAARKGYESIRRAVEDGKILPEVIHTAADRIDEIKANFFEDFKLIDPSAAAAQLRTPEHLEIVKNITS